MDNNTFKTKGKKFYTTGWPLKRMAFLYLYLVEHGLTVEEFATGIGMLPPTVRRWFRQDNISLSSLTAMLKQAGLQVVMEYEVRKVCGHDGGAGPVRLIGRPMARRESDSLLFLTNAMRTARCSASELSQRLGLNECTVRRWFRVQNISLASLYRISEVMDWPLSIRLEPAAEGKDAPASEMVLPGQADRDGGADK